MKLPSLKKTTRLLMGIILLTAPIWAEVDPNPKPTHDPAGYWDHVQFHTEDGQPVNKFDLKKKRVLPAKRYFRKALPKKLPKTPPSDFDSQWKSVILSWSSDIYDRVGLSPEYEFIQAENARNMLILENDLVVSYEDQREMVLVEPDIQKGLARVLYFSPVGKKRFEKEFPFGISVKKGAVSPQGSYFSFIAWTGFDEVEQKFFVHQADGEQVFSLSSEKDAFQSFEPIAFSPSEQFVAIQVTNGDGKEEIYGKNLESGEFKILPKEFDLFEVLDDGRLKIQIGETEKNIDFLN